MLSPRHMSEVAPPATRGAITSQNQVFITLGTFLAYCSGIPYDYGADRVTVLGVELSWWRVPLLIGCAIAALQVHNPRRGCFHARISVMANYAQDPRFAIKSHSV